MNLSLPEACRDLGDLDRSRSQGRSGCGLGALESPRATCHAEMLCCLPMVPTLDSPPGSNGSLGKSLPLGEGYLEESAQRETSHEIPPSGARIGNYVVAE